MMKTFRPFFSAPELEPDELPPDELEELHAAARMDSRTSGAVPRLHGLLSASPLLCSGRSRCAFLRLRCGSAASGPDRSGGDRQYLAASLLWNVSNSVQ
jgi:hypothetical protein